MFKWGGITLAIGIALVILEIYMASKKKEGVTATDKKRIMGLFWLALLVTGLVSWLVWASD